MMSKEFEIGVGLIERFSETLEKIASAGSKEEAKPLIESIKHPITGALAQIKAGQGPLKEEIIERLTVVVSQMRELTDLEALKENIIATLNLVKQAKEVQEQSANAS